MSPDAIVLEKVVREMQGSRSRLEVSMRMTVGECVVVSGPSRSGKSLLIELCAGLVQPTSGRVLMCGSEWATLSATDHVELRRRIGTVLQQPGLLSNMTVYHNVALPLRYHQGTLNEKTCRDIVTEHVYALRLTDIQDRFPAQLTSGECRRVAMARAMILDPDILLLDDAVGGLDADTVDIVQKYLNDRRAKRPVTVLATLRVPSPFLKQADRVAFLREGNVEAFGPRETVRQEGTDRMKFYLL